MTGIERFGPHFLCGKRTTCHPLARRGLDKIGIKPASKKILHNLTFAEIASEEKKRGEGVFTANGTFCVDTGV